ncbi:sulfur acquisition oxidoreductase, SfnB family [Arboricoccus pini]|uniref:Sulfur acquisition oxidoreductase, SfnB family n=1 Tax=Arboricoccus pini TaxID=1963835 RepID=A0A212S391_9PROT|nr:SfnB family sulfur acquisition oxidoreductase [Arboricoccus pini]SNB79652.1 sulfur acquisition oxidoreductase, SfnB family [Arboricoccus pini]
MVDIDRLSDDFRPPERRQGQARILRDDAEALAVAAELAAELASGAARRDQERILPREELDKISDAGLFAITVPKAYGGAGVKLSTVARVIALLSAADGSIGQIPQNHFFLLEALRLLGTEAQKRFFFDRVLAGERFFNALSERGTKTAHDFATRFVRQDDGYRLNGRKFYSTGVLFAHWIGVIANDETGRTLLAFVPPKTPGITLKDDWSGFGQRVTGSGTTVLEDVQVHPFGVLDFQALFERPTAMGPYAQLMHAAVQQGMAEGSLAAMVDYVRHRARPWRDAGVDRAADDPYLLALAGETKVRVDAAALLLERAGRLVDQSAAGPQARNVAEASIAVAEAKAASTETALLASSRIIELGGSSATLAEYDLDRFWRNARTHSVHDPVRWKYKFIGDYWLNGNVPPRHGAI